MTNKALEVYISGHDMEAIISAIEYRLEYLEKAWIVTEIEERETLQRVIDSILEQSAEAADYHQLPGA